MLHIFEECYISKYMSTYVIFQYFLKSKDDGNFLCKGPFTFPSRYVKISILIWDLLRSFEKCKSKDPANLPLYILKRYVNIYKDMFYAWSFYLDMTRYVYICLDIWTYHDISWHIYISRLGRIRDYGLSRQSGPWLTLSLHNSTA